MEPGASPLHFFHFSLDLSTGVIFLIPVFESKKQDFNVHVNKRVETGKVLHRVCLAEYPWTVLDPTVNMVCRVDDLEILSAAHSRNVDLWKIDVASSCLRNSCLCCDVDLNVNLCVSVTCAVVLNAPALEVFCLLLRSFVGGPRFRRIFVRRMEELVHCWSDFAGLTSQGFSVDRSCF